MRDGRGRGVELGTAILVVLGIAAASLPTAVVWWLLAPVPQLTRVGDFAVLSEAEGEAAIAADGWFAVCTATAGLTCAVLVFAVINHARVWSLLALAGGGLLASVLTWQIGIRLGPGPAEQSLLTVLDGGTFSGPLELSAKGVLLAWPLASVIAYFALTAGLEPPARAHRGGQPAATQQFPITVLRPGYAIGEVDQFFARLEAGDVNGVEAADVRFTPTRLRSGYDGATVDAALLAVVNGAADRSPRPDGSARP